MSRLRLFWPSEPDCDEHHHAREEEPLILSFSRLADRFGNGMPSDLVSRARLLYSNRQCRFCGSPVVQPLTLDDVTLNRNRLPIPGTGTLVGFHCDRCRAQWTA